MSLVSLPRSPLRPSLPCAGHVEEFKKTLSTEVQKSIKELGKVREEKRALEHQIADLFALKAKFGGNVSASFAALKWMAADAPSESPRIYRSTSEPRCEYHSGHGGCYESLRARRYGHGRYARYDWTRWQGASCTPWLVTQRRVMRNRESASESRTSY